jgi:hypothetical protein
MKLNLFLLSAAAMVSAATATPTVETIDPVELATAGNYAILAKTGISTVPDSAITGHIAVSPIKAAAITDFGLIIDSSNQFSTCAQVDDQSRVYAPDYIGSGGGISTPAILTTAVSDMETAYTNAAGRLTTDDEKINPGGGEIGGMTLVAGVYNFDRNIMITTEVKFTGTSDSVFILQTSKSIVQAANVNVVLEGGVLAENIFWQVAEQVTVHAGSLMKGVLLVKTAATFNTESSLDGRILAQTAVTLQKARITEAPVRSNN